MALLERWLSERREVRDPLTAARMWQLTGLPADHFPLTGADSSVTPTGKHLLFLSDRAGGSTLDLFQLELATGEIVQVTEAAALDSGGVTPAADGRRAIAGLQGEDGEVVAIDLETGEWETLAVFLDAGLDGCHLSASGEYVVTVVTREGEAALTAVHTEGMRTTPILEDLDAATGARFSPDSKNSVVYVSSAPEPAVRCVEFDGTGDRLLCAVQRDGSTHEVGGPAAHPVWRGSGDEVLFVAGSEAGPVLAVSREGGSHRVVSVLPCRWVRSNARGDRLVVVIEGGSELSQIARRGPLAGVAPGSTTGPDRSPLVALIDFRSGEVRALVSLRSTSASPSFSPDRRSIIYADRDAAGHSQLFLLPLEED